MPTVVKTKDHLVKCHNCDSTIKYNKKEIVKKEYRDISQVLCTHEYITCPSCNKPITISST